MSPARAKKKAARKPAKRRAAPKRRPAKKRAVKRAPKKRAAKRHPRKRAKLKLVRRPAAKKKVARRAKAPRPPAFAGAVESASARDLALFDLVRARVEVQAAFQGMVAATAERPLGEGKWNPRQIALHLHYWDREMLPWVEKAYLHNQRPPHTHDDILAANVSSQEELGAHDWDSARRLMQQSREALLEALQSLPEEPAEMWSSEHALGWLIRMLSHHDRHHAAAVKDARGRDAAKEAHR